MEVAQRLVRQGGNVAYVRDAVVYHHHKESWPQVQRRFEREAIALQKIMPQVHVGVVDFMRYFLSSTLKDWRRALASAEFMCHAVNIFRYRWNQYLGVYKGNNQHRRLSHAQKDKYFYPS
jgi:GT2 family glycosyltransferase